MITRPPSVLVACMFLVPVAGGAAAGGHQPYPIAGVGACPQPEEIAWYKTDRATRHADYPWWRGNLHTHTLWSDGDNYPELIVEWYKNNGYHFLALSDHNILSEGQKWIHPEKTRAGDADTFQMYLDRFGPEWVETRVVDEAFHQWLYSRPGGRFHRPEEGREIEIGDTAVRLKPLNEFRPLFEEPGRFLLVQGEEITDGLVHVNATNLARLIEPQGGETSVEKIRNNIEAVIDQRMLTGQPILPHLNHPNWRWSLTAEEMAQVRQLRFFEVFNGHGGVRNYGDGVRPGTERMWDIILTRRLAETGYGVVYGLGTDDSHRYTEPPSPDNSAPGRGWVVVRAPFLTPEHLIHAMEAGDFYASSGVVLKDIRFDGKTLSIEIEGAPGATYSTRFIGTRRGYDPETTVLKDEDGAPVAIGYSPDVGEILAEIKGLRADYTLQGDEIYVRATVTSSELHPRPFQEGDHKQAWIQPIVPE